MSSTPAKSAATSTPSAASTSQAASTSTSTPAATTTTVSGGEVKEVCRAFRNNHKCRWENDCKYEHSEGPPIEPPPRDYTPKGDCHKWKEESGCRFAERCRFLHGPEDKRTTYRPERKDKAPNSEGGDDDNNGGVNSGEKQICRNWSRRGKCRWGDKCRNLHEKKEGVAPVKKRKPRKKAAAAGGKAKAKGKAEGKSKAESKSSSSSSSTSSSGATSSANNDKKKRRKRKAKGKKKAVSNIVLTEENKFDSTGVELCRNFRNNGRCRFGQDCTFSHEAGEPIGQPAGRERVRVPGDCFSFRNEGKCEFGDQCKFLHGENDTRDFSIRRRAKGPCYQWSEEGKCEWGDKCRFLHEASTTSA